MLRGIGDRMDEHKMDLAKIISFGFLIDIIEIIELI